MKLTVENRAIERSELFKEIDFKISSNPESQALQFEMWRKGIYQDPIMAICRELSRNATDAHVEAGIESRPIEVTLPNRMDCYFKVRDFGKGLSPKEIEEVYSVYFESTRRNSNNYTGALGLGAKSPLAISSSFVTISYQNKKKITYNSFIDESGRGKIAVLGEEETIEEDGLEVIVPVKQNDIQVFIDRATRLYKYFSIKPKLSGIDPIPDISHDNHYLLSGNGWFYWGNDNRSPIAVMSETPYSISLDSMEGKLTEIQKEFLQSGVEIIFENGSLHFTPSRENLRHSEFTNAAIIKRVDEIIAEISQITIDKFNSCKNLFEAKTLYRQVFGRRGGFGSKLGSILTDKIIWNGITINDWRIDLKGIDDVKVLCFSKKSKKNSYGYKVVRENVDGVSCAENADIYVNDLPTLSGLKARAKTLFARPDLEYVYVLDFTRDKYQAFELTTGLNPTTLKAVSTVAKAANSGGGSGTVNEKNKEKVFTFNKDNAHSNYGRWRGHSKSDAWDVAELPDSEDIIYYVDIERYEPIGRHGSYGRVYSLKELVNNLEKMGVKLEDIYGFKPGVIKSPKWVNFYDYAKKEAEALVVAQAQVIVDAAYLEEHKRDAHDLINEALINNISKLNDGLYKDYLNKIVATVIPKTNETIDRLKNNFNIQIPKDIKISLTLSPDLDKVKERYPLVPHLSHSYGEWETDKLNAVIEYINLIDGK